MENATKALLIAAAVLIAIVLIALGVKLVNSSGDAAGQANQVSSALNSSTANTVTEIETMLKATK